MSRSRDLTTGAVGMRLYTLAVPMIFGIIASLSTSIVDTYFVGQLGTDELAALSFTFPVTFAIMSLSIGLGAGAASVVSRAVGARSTDDAERLATDSLVLASLLVVVVCGIGFFTIRPLFAAMGAEGNVLDLIVRYMRIWYYSMPFLVIPMVANAILRAAGDAFWPSMMMIISALINVVATPALMFGWSALPALGFEGAAWGTFVSRVVAILIAVWLLLFKEKLLSLSMPPMDELVQSWKRIVKVAVPAAVGNMTNPLAITLITAIIAGFGASTVAAYGVATRIESFASIPLLALSAAIGPMCGQNWGAGNIARVQQSMRLCYGFALIWAISLAGVLWFAAEPLARAFSNDPQVVSDATLYLRIVPVSLWGYGIVIVAAGAYNSLGKSVTGLSYYLLRAAVFMVPAVYIAAQMAGKREVFIAISATNALGGLLVAWLSLRWVNRQMNKQETIAA